MGVRMRMEGVRDKGEEKRGARGELKSREEMGREEVRIEENSGMMQIKSFSFGFEV